MAAFDTPPARLGAGVTVDFNDTDEEGDTPDVDGLSFGDGTRDEPFSVVVLCKPDANDAIMRLVAKRESTSADEWSLSLDSDGKVTIYLVDESRSANLSSTGPTGVGTAWALVAAVYDGSGAASGLTLYQDGLKVAASFSGSGTYLAMENVAARLHIGAMYAAKQNFFDGQIALVGVSAKAHSANDIWAIKELCNSYFGLSL